MVRRLLLYTVLVAALAGFLLLRRETRRCADAVFAAAPPSVALATRARDREGGYLRPDARFLAAVGDVEHIVTGAPSKVAAAKFEDEGWTIRAGRREVGRLPEFPRFEEMRGVLTAWALALGAPESLAAGADVNPARERAAAAIDGELNALHALRAADLAGRAWAAGHRDAATAKRGARALVWMAAECFDAADAGESIAARALAWCAVVRAAEPAALPRETVLLAMVMGYPAEACEAAEKLAEMEPVRLYALRRDEMLDAIASRGGSGREARWLALRRAVERRDLESWAVAASRGLDADTLLALPLTSSSLALGRFETDIEAGNTLLLAVAADLRLNRLTAAPIAAIDNRPMGDTMEMFEALLDACPESSDGAFLDRAVLCGWYRAAFYSALMGIGDHLRERYSDVDAFLAFAKDMEGGAETPPVAAEFQRWFMHLAELRGDPTVRGTLKADLHRLPHFGAGMPLVTWRAIQEHTAYSDPFIRQCAPLLQGELDSRPEYLHAWGWVLMTQLFDLPQGERLLAEAVRAGHRGDLARQGWWAAYRGDRATLGALMDDGRFSPEARCALIHTLRTMTPEDSVRLDALCERLSAERPDDWELLRPYLRSLESRHRTDRVRELTRAWLARPDRSTRAFDDIEARDQLANACLEEGRIDEGYEAIRSVVGSWESRAMALAAELMDRKGEPAAAETLAMMRWRRYLDSDPAQALVVDLFWRHGKYDLAARMLARAPQALSAGGWRWDLGQRFARFEREQPREARHAVDAIVALHMDDWRRLGGLVVALAAAGRREAAVELAERVTANGQIDKALLIPAYQNVKAARGGEAAADWLLAHLPNRDASTLAYLHLFAYALGACEVQWILPIPEGGEEIVENLWLMRVAAVARDSAGTPEQRVALRARFAPAGPHRYRHFGRLLLGMESADSVLALPLDHRAQGEAYYYIGLWCQAQGDYRAAAEWYARCLDLNVWNNGEHHWAMAQLDRWAARNRTLERVAAEDHRAPRPAKAAPRAI